MHDGCKCGVMNTPGFEIALVVKSANERFLEVHSLEKWTIRGSERSFESERCFTLYWVLKAPVF